MQAITSLFTVKPVTRRPKVAKRGSLQVVAHGGDEQRRCAVGADETRDALGDVAADASGILAHDAGG